MKKIYTLMLSICSIYIANAQTWNLTGNTGIATSNFIGTTDSKDLIFKVNNIERGRLQATPGAWRFGNATNFAKIDSTGKLSFGGSGAYVVAGNKYAFQYSGNTNYGLFFNSSSVQYEFRNGSAVPVFSVNANTGSSVFNGTVRIGAYTLPSTDGLNGQVLTTNGAGTVNWLPVSGGANTDLSNLTSPTAVEVALLPYKNNVIDIGSSTLSWKDLYLGGSIYVNGLKFISNINGTGAGNVAVGTQALYANSTGYSNIAIGSGALKNNSQGYNLVAIGDSALLNQSANSFGLYYNTATGSKALYTNTTGYHNTANGALALYSNNTGFLNTAFGISALYTNTEGSFNTAIGAHAMTNITTGEFNTGVGLDVMLNNFLGSYNSAFGCEANIDGDLNNAVAIGFNATAEASNQVVIGNTSITSIGGYTNWTNFSDGRYKQNIKQNVPGLAFINKLNPVTYTLNVNAIDKKLHQSDTLKTSIAEKHKTKENLLQQASNEKSKIVYTGFVAQEVEKAAEELHYNFSGVDKPKDVNKSFYGLRYGDFVVPLVKAVQELSHQNDALKKQNDSLNARLDRIERLLNISSQSLNAINENIQHVELSTSAKLEQNVPNPFTNTTNINYYLPFNSENAYINFYNASGALMRSIKLSGNGKGTIQVNTDQLPDGIYQYALILDNKIIDTKKMMSAK